MIRTLPPALVGVAAGWWVMGRIPASSFGPIIGGTVLVLAALQALRDWKPGLWQSVPHSRGFAWTMGFIAGVTTMVANAAGPVMGLYLLAVALPKDAFVGTAAWFFLLINLLKVPFSAQLGLITPATLAFNALIIPAIAAGLFLGRAAVARLPQKAFDTLVLAFAVIASLRAFLSGVPTSFNDVTLDFSGLSEFEAALYRALRAVPWGETVSYGDLARHIGEGNGAARGVGVAMGRNPWPLIVPCHRVLTSEGKLGGFSAPGGGRTKSALLAREGVHLDGGQLALFD